MVTQVLLHSDTAPPAWIALCPLLNSWRSEPMAAEKKALKSVGMVGFTNGLPDFAMLIEVAFSYNRNVMNVHAGLHTAITRTRSGVASRICRRVPSERRIWSGCGQGTLAV